MKNYKKGILATMIVATMPLFAATSNDMIKVNTFVDEDGENNNACSLREALKTAEIRKNYGGCIVSDTSSVTRKKIQLEAGTYTLKRELVPNVNVIIFGALPVDWEKKSVITDRYPAQTALKTTIEANNTSRVFNTTSGLKALTLNNLILKNGRTNDRGGAIYAGAEVSLQNVHILASQAGISGGAIFLAGPTASLSISNSVIQGNQSPIGSVLGMSCFNDNVYSKRKIDVSFSSIIKNGSLTSTSIFDFCGEPTINLNTNTIAQNISNISSGSILKFTGDTRAGNTVNNTSSILSNASSLDLMANTIVENQSHTVLLYDKLGLKLMSFNVLSHNTSSYACRYLLGSATEQQFVKFFLDHNAIALTGNNKCDLPKESVPETQHTNLDVGNVNNLRTLLSSLQPASESTAFMPLYYPINNRTATDLIDVSELGNDDCGAKDQRGIARIANGTLFYDPDARNSCDIGSVELMKLTAGDLEDLSNSSIKSLADSYKAEIDKYEFLLKNPDDPLLITSDKYDLEKYKKLNDGLKANLHYRAIYIDLKGYQLPIPQEIVLSDGSHRLQFFNNENYIVTTEALGKGQINDTITNIDVSDKPNIVCEWNSDLEQIILYRKDDSITQAGDKIFCKYTIQSRTDSSIKSSGLIKAAFVNVAPEAKNTSVTLKYQQNQTVSLDLLKLSNDFGDTGEGGQGPDNEPNKPQFWRNADGIELPIRLSNVPTKNLVVTADRQGACPEPDQKETCYGGNIYIKESNTFNPFNYSFNYQVYDADGAISNTATVSVISTATTTDDTRNASNNGGGSIGVFSIFGLIGLLAYRRFRK
ncbi:CSLREA domain-containing protein [Acinetobacter junii]|uniref:CSLREA domain-containing protein n=1 Tax=Acinetobacter junii TaxID=40215 RepID=UPI000F67C3A8|nr:CSLREA domain-containing protein [Acinetobacter junii]RSE35980.1 CSLREA domain-containing protein [Acinetobacter junii]